MNLCKLARFKLGCVDVAADVVSDGASRLAGSVLPGMLGQLQPTLTKNAVLRIKVLNEANEPADTLAPWRSSIWTL